MGDGTAVSEYYGFSLGPNRMLMLLKDKIDRNFMQKFPCLFVNVDSLNQFFEASSKHKDEL